MNKLKALLFALPLVALAACDKDDDTPDVAVAFDITGYWTVESSGTMYVTPENPVVFNGYEVATSNGKPAGLTNMAFYINGFTVLPQMNPNYLVSIPADMFLEGDNQVDVTMTVVVEGSSLMQGIKSYHFTAVTSQSDLPDGAVYIPNPGENNNGDNDDDMTQAPSE